MKRIQLGGRNGYSIKGYADVDDEDFDVLNAFRWYKQSPVGYAARKKIENGKPFFLLMHRVILDAKKGEQVDHKDQNKLNNCRSNLRIATIAENNQNRVKRGLWTSQYRGVFYDKRDKLWRAQISFKGKKRALGYFRIQEDAARAYNGAAKELYGEFAYVNPLKAKLKEI